MDKADRKLLLSYAEAIKRVSTMLREAEGVEKNDDYRRFFRQVAEDLEHVTVDFEDTIVRL